MSLDNIQNLWYNIAMIRSFKHKGLCNFYQTGSIKGIQAIHERKLRLILGALDSARSIDVLDIPMFRLHKLKGNMQHLYAITVQANWRITFEFRGEDVYVVDYQDYH